MLFSLPPLEPRSYSTAVLSGGDRPLDRAAARDTPDDERLTALHLLRDGHEAFAARMLLVRSAERTLDLQYYIWNGDLTGTLLLDELRAAAARGVRVRLLLDDNGIGGLDQALADVNALPNVEVRLYNPFVIRWWKPLNYLFAFLRLNRRMHNKSLIADGAAAIVGGRNIGDEYFGAGDGSLLADLDVIAVGPVVPAVAQQFDDYWNGPSAYPAEKILKKKPSSGAAYLRKARERVEKSSESADYADALRNSAVVQRLVSGDLDLIEAPVQLVMDSTDKTLARSADGDLLINRLSAILDDPSTELSLVSGYFVPGDDGVAAFSGYAEAGVSVSVLTNSYATTDVGVVQAGYAPARKPLLRAGVRLFEMKPRAQPLNRRKARKIGAAVRDPADRPAGPARARARILRPARPCCTPRPSGSTDGALSSARSTSIFVHAISTRNSASS